VEQGDNRRPAAGVNQVGRKIQPALQAVRAPVFGKTLGKPIKAVPGHN